MLLSKQNQRRGPGRSRVRRPRRERPNEVRVQPASLRPGDGMRAAAATVSPPGFESLGLRPRGIRISTRPYEEGRLLSPIPIPIPPICT